MKLYNLLHLVNNLLHAVKSRIPQFESGHPVHICIVLARIIIIIMMRVMVFSSASIELSFIFKLPHNHFLIFYMFLWH